MIVQFHTPAGIVPVDTENYTETELADLRIDPQEFYKLYVRPEELKKVFAEAHASSVIPPPGLTELILQICEYLTLKG